jgi:hypothetical protein
VQLKLAQQQETAAAPGQHQLGVSRPDRVLLYHGIQEEHTVPRRGAVGTGKHRRSFKYDNGHPNIGLQRIGDHKFPGAIAIRAICASGAFLWKCSINEKAHRLDGLAQAGG